MPVDLSKEELRAANALCFRNKALYKRYASNINTGYCGEVIGNGNKAICYICNDIIENYRLDFSNHIRQHLKYLNAFL